MNSEIDTGTANKSKLQVITSENRKVMLYGIDIHNKSTFMDTVDTEFWRVAKNLA